MKNKTNLFIGLILLVLFLVPIVNAGDFSDSVYQINSVEDFKNPRWKDLSFWDNFKNLFAIGPLNPIVYKEDGEIGVIADEIATADCSNAQLILQVTNPNGATDQVYLKEGSIVKGQAMQKGGYYVLKSSDPIGTYILKSRLLCVSSSYIDSGGSTATVVVQSKSVPQQCTERYLNDWYCGSDYQSKRDKVLASCASDQEVIDCRPKSCNTATGVCSTSSEPNPTCTADMEQYITCSDGTKIKILKCSQAVGGTLVDTGFKCPTPIPTEQVCCKDENKVWVFAWGETTYSLKSKDNCDAKNVVDNSLCGTSGGTNGGNGGGSTTTNKQDSLTSSEWSKTTYKGVLGSMCETVDECEPVDGKEVRCETSDEIAKRNVKAFESAGGVTGNLYQSTCGGIMGLLDKVGFNFCSFIDIPDGTCRVQSTGIDWNMDLGGGIKLWYVLVAVGFIILLMMMGGGRR